MLGIGQSGHGPVVAPASRPHPSRLRASIVSPPAPASRPPASAALPVAPPVPNVAPAVSLAAFEPRGSLIPTSALQLISPNDRAAVRHWRRPMALRPQVATLSALPLDFTKRTRIWAIDVPAAIPQRILDEPDPDVQHETQMRPAPFPSWRRRNVPRSG